MPRIISDELYDQLMGCVKQQRLLGVMGMLEKMRDESVPVFESTIFIDKLRSWTEDADAQSTDHN